MESSSQPSARGQFEVLIVGGGRIGCDEWSPEGCRLESKVGKTHVRGLYVVGDASRDVLQVIVAAGEGSEAAISVNKELLCDDGVL